MNLKIKRNIPPVIIAKYRLTFSSISFSGTEELLSKFMQQNVELQHEIETLRAKLEYTFTLVNEKFNEQTPTATSVSIIQGAFEQIRRMEMNLQELKYRSASQQEENDFLKYLVS
jgi:hypothetical protein